MSTRNSTIGGLGVRVGSEPTCSHVGDIPRNPPITASDSGLNWVVLHPNAYTIIKKSPSGL
ncbi:MAG: hypothetical protein CVU40_16180 [Chloroflexi bacterium HGW-Chloroflexi-2]|nr:MAG: hypothetical protein CVU40_16180 [Chloroflexi bacterium HGW-Chloroflexi-2]